MSVPRFLLLKRRVCRFPLTRCMAGKEGTSETGGHRLYDFGGRSNHKGQAVRGLFRDRVVGEALTQQLGAGLRMGCYSFWGSRELYPRVAKMPCKKW